MLSATEISILVQPRRSTLTGLACGHLTPGNGRTGGIFTNCDLGLRKRCGSSALGFTKPDFLSQPASGVGNTGGTCGKPTSAFEPPRTQRPRVTALQLGSWGATICHRAIEEQCHSSPVESSTKRSLVSGARCRRQPAPVYRWHLA